MKIEIVSCTPFVTLEAISMIQFTGARKLSAHVSNYCSSQGFQNEDEFFKSQLSTGEMCHFTTCMYHTHLCKHP
jgi:hypothetical protein